MKPPDIELREELERRIVHGLSCEWKNALWILSPEERIRMKRPLFSLADMNSRLGLWSAAKNEISLSRNFALSYPWNDIRDVLLHEMAHQYTEQVLGIKDDIPHGPHFQKACHRLRANPKASGCYKPLHDHLKNQSTNNRDRILSRVTKLMSLARSRNRHEAEAAMSKAHALMKKYNIHVLKNTKSRDYLSIFIGAPALRHHREEYHLANMLQTYYFVEGLWVSAYVLPKGKMGRVLEITGTIENIKIASYVYDFVKNYIDRHWRLYNRDQGLNRYRKTDFAVGIVEGFCNKLKACEDSSKNENTSTALIHVKDSLLEAFMAYKYPNTKTFQRSASSQNEKILKDGFDLGKKLVISKGITQREISGKLLGD